MKRKEMWDKIQRLQREINVLRDREAWITRRQLEDRRWEESRCAARLDQERDLFAQETRTLRTELDAATKLSYGTQAELSWLRQRVGEGLYEEFVAETQKEKK